METTENATRGWVRAEDARGVGEKGGLRRESLARTFGLSEDIGKVARGCGAEVTIAQRERKVFP